MTTKKQVQKAGDDSLNVQAETVNIETGLSYSDVKEIALDIFRQNFEKLSTVAAEKAIERAKEITDKFLNELKKENREVLNRVQDPDFQYSLFTIQKEYAKTGDRDLGDLLIDILVERTKVDQRGLLQIVLNESLAVAPKLTKEQLCALSVIFTIRYMRYTKIDSLNTLGEYLERRLSPFVQDLPMSRANYQHLEFAGCGGVSVASYNINKVVKGHYPGVFTKGFSREMYDEMFGKIKGSEEWVIPCLHDGNLLQFDSLDFDELKKKMEMNGVGENEYKKAESLWNKYLMSDEEVENQLIEMSGSMKAIYKTWNGSAMKNMNLTSVGIAIAHAYIRSRIGESGDLSIWIS